MSKPRKIPQEHPMKQPITTVLFDVYGTLIDIHTNEHRDDIFDTLSRFLEYRRIFGLRG